MSPVWLWCLLLAPLAAAVLIAALTQRARGLSAALSIGAVLLAFGIAAALFLRVQANAVAAVPPLPWLSFPGFEVNWGFAVDRLSALMLFVVTGVGAAIHIYSLAYMRGDPGFSRYFACLSLFTFSMLGVVLATNFIQIFIFWELVGLSSYLLIGFWFERPAAAAAGLKAFIVNRIGDFGLLVGILMIWGLTGSVDFARVESAVSAPGLPQGALTAAALLIFCGAVGKSAQFPLHVWLPDAMEGPTPVSALIHAATMVAAGVYMLCRVSWLLVPQAAIVIAWIGAITALMASLIAIGQSDIKRVLAYSTVSQLGYMVMAVGLGGPTEAMTHLTAHAFFKALLFLAAGSVIMALHHEQDIWKMGGLARRMPYTFVAFLVGTLALAGVPPLSGFYTKDAILILALDHNEPLFGLAAAAAFCTAFYMGRVLFVAFLGEPRDAHLHAAANENGPLVLVPLGLLAVLSIGCGWHGLIPHALQPGLVEGTHGWGLSIMLVSIPVAGFAAALALYARPRPSDQPLRQALGGLYQLFARRFYFDELYAALIRGVQTPLAAACASLDRRVLQDDIIGGAGAGTNRMGQWIRLLQNGDLRLYAFIFGVGVAVLIHLVGRS